MDFAEAILILLMAHLGKRSCKQDGYPWKEWKDMLYSAQLFKDSILLALPYPEPPLGILWRDSAECLHLPR